MQYCAIFHVQARALSVLVNVLVRERSFNEHVANRFRSSNFAELVFDIEVLVIVNE
jgi:hypothetical protein